MQLVVSTLGKACTIENRAALERGKLNAVHAQADSLVSEVKPPMLRQTLIHSQGSSDGSLCAAGNMHESHESLVLTGAGAAGVAL